MNRSLSGFVGLAALCLLPIRLRAGILYVNASATGSTHDGQTWATAFPQLSTALAVASAQASPSNPVSIYLAAGTYVPQVVNPQSPRSSTFRIPSYTALYGGFSATSPEASLNNRSASTPLPVLSGELSYAHSIQEAFSPPTSATAALSFVLPDSTDGGFADNVQNVVTISNATGVVMDSLVISGGYAGSSSVPDSQIGMTTMPTTGTTGDPLGFAAEASTLYAGGGIFIGNDTLGTSGLPDLVLSNCVIAGNYAQGFGGGIAAVSANVLVADCIFAGNAAGSDGGAYWGRNTGTQWSGSTFLNNLAGSSGGAVAFDTAPQLPAGFGQSQLAAALQPSVASGTIRDLKVATKAAIRLEKAARASSGSGFTGKLKAFINGASPETSATEAASTDVEDLAETGSDAVGAVFGAVTAAVQITDFAIKISAALGGNSNQFTDYWTTTFMPNFNAYATPAGWVTGYINDFKESLQPTAAEIRYSYTVLQNYGPVIQLFDACTFTGNSASASGGAVSVSSDCLQMEESSLTGNSSYGDGGAVALDSFATASLFSCGLAGNVAAGHSALSVVGHSGLRVINCSVVNNASTGVGGYAIGATMDGYARVYNTVLWGNTNLLPANAVGGADVYAARRADLAPSEQQLYDQDARYSFSYAGVVDVAYCDLQSFSRYTTNDWSQSDDGALYYSVSTHAELLAFEAVANLVDADGTEDYHSFQVTGEGVRVVGRNNFGTDPKLFNNWMPGIGSPLINAGSVDRESNASIAPAFDSDLIGQARGGIYSDVPVPAGAAAAPISIGAVQTNQYPVTLTGAAPGRIFVAPAATGNGSGSDWANATSDLPGALAQSHVEVWVRQGTYYPSSTGDSTQSFALGDGTVAYGGFAGTENLLSQRTVGPFPTVLSGAIQENSGGVLGSNSYHVVTALNHVAAATLDGFTVLGGSAMGQTTDQEQGGGVYAVAAPLVLRNDLFSGNASRLAGGGVYVGSSTFCNVVGCQFQNNSALGVGGALSVQGALDLDRCVFSGNSGGTDGAAIAATPNLATDVASVFNSVFTANTCGAGSVVTLGTNQNLLQNCTVYGNTAAIGLSFAPAPNASGGSSTVLNSVIYQTLSPTTGTRILEAQEIQATGYAASDPGLKVSSCVIQQADRFIIEDPTNRDVGVLGFDDPAHGKFDLLPTSELIDAGAGGVYLTHNLDVSGALRSVGAAIDIGAYEYQGTGTAVYGSMAVERSLTAGGPVYSLVFQPARSLGGSVTYAWTVNMGDGQGFVPLSAIPNEFTYLSADNLQAIQILNPPPNWNDWVFQVAATGSATATSTAVGVLTGCARSRLYVDAAATGSNDGSSWANAYTALETALRTAPDWAEIWVKQGTYRTSATADDTFLVRPGLQVYGGFAGNETMRSQRGTDPATTVLDGAHNSPATTAAMANATVSYALSGYDPGEPCNLDGFTIRNGKTAAFQLDNATTGDGPSGDGSCQINNCRIANPFGIGVLASECNLALISSTISQCSRNGMFVSDGSLIMRSVQVVDNTGQGGAGIRLTGAAALQLVNCTVADNTSSDVCGGILADDKDGATVAVSNSILWGNRDESGDFPSALEGEQLSNLGGLPLSGQAAVVASSIIEGLNAYAGNGNEGYDPLFTASPTGDYSLVAGSPAVGLGAGALPYSGTAAPELDFTALPESSTVQANLASATFTASGDAAGLAGITWQINLGQGWVNASPSVLGSVVTTGSGVSSLTVSATGASLPTFEVRIETAGGIFIGTAQTTVIPPPIRYVNAATTNSTQDGLSWNTAFSSISQALIAATPTAASGFVPSGVEIWVAQGTYNETGTPQIVGYDANNLPVYASSGGALQLIKNVALYGGFTGNETSRSQRATSPALTIVKGSFQSGGQSYGFLGAQLALDGFTVVGTGKDLPGISASGGGSFNHCVVTNDDPEGTGAEVFGLGATFTNCTFSGAAAGGAFVQDSVARFANCTFSQNLRSPIGGGAITAESSDVTVSGCAFSANGSAAGAGGGIYFDGTGGHILTVATSLFTGNRAYLGSAIYLTHGKLLARNVTIADNAATLLAAVYVDQATADLANSILWSNQGGVAQDLLSSYHVPKSGPGLVEQQQLHGEGGSTITVAASLVQDLAAYATANSRNAPFDPLFAGAGNAQPYGLSPNSPALALGQLAALTAVQPAVQDPNRPNGACDAGAYEFAGTGGAPVDLTAGPSVAYGVYGAGTASFVVVNPAFNPVTWQRLVGGNWVAVSGAEFTAAVAGNTSTLTLSGASAADAGEYRFVMASRNFNSPAFSLGITSRTAVYVNAAAAPGGDGTTWTKAFNTLEAALASHRSGLEIRVAQGTYVPVATLPMQPGCIVEGGYPADGSITDPAQRDPVNRPTVVTDGALGPLGSAGQGVLFEFDADSGPMDANTSLDGLILQGTGINRGEVDTIACDNGANPSMTRCVFQNAASNITQLVADPASSALVQNSQFLNNAGFSVQLFGGMVQFVGCTLSGNSNQLVTGYGTATFTDSTISNNPVGDAGSEDLIDLESGPSGESSSLGLSRTKVLGNTASGFLIRGEAVTVGDSLIAQNAAAALAVDGNCSIVQSTLADNASTVVGPTATVLVDGSGGALTIVNSILWNNQILGNPPSFATQVSSEGTANVSDSIVQGAGANATNLIGYNPLFTAESAGDYTLSSSSPAVGAGDPAAAISTDLAGTARGTATDLGAYAFTGNRAQAAAVDVNSLPVPGPAYLANNATLTVTYPAGTVTGATWYYEVNGTLTPIVPSAHEVIVNTATSSALTIVGVTAADAGSVVFRLNGSAYTSPAYALSVVPRPIVYVANGAHTNPSGDGTSWANAYPSLDVAISQAPFGAEIWVASSSYSWPQSETVRLRSGVHVLGGFPYGATSQSQRSASAASTIVAGAITNDGFQGAPDSTSLVDGFTFVYQQFASAAVLNAAGSPVFNNCAFQLPVVVNAGSPAFTQCSFSTVYPVPIGDALQVGGGSPALTNCQFVGTANSRTAIDVLGGSFSATSCSIVGVQAHGFPLIAVNGGSAAFDRLTLTGNTAARIISAGASATSVRVADALIANNTSQASGLIVSASPDCEFTFCTVYGNTAPDTTGGIWATAGSVTVSDSIVWGNSIPAPAPGENPDGPSVEAQQITAAPGAACALASNLIEGFATLGGTGNLPDDPLFTDAPGGNYTLTAHSPAINRGSTGGSAANYALDLPGNPRVAGAAPDLGAYEFQGTPAAAFAVVGASPVTVAAGTTASFSVQSATGDGSEFSWQIESAPGVWSAVSTGGLYTVTSGGGVSTLAIGPTTAANNGQVFRAVAPNGTTAPVTLTVQGGAIIYVNAAATGSGNGQNWANAYTSIAASQGSWAANAQVWVASGTYPIPARFGLPPGLRLYGGFNGTESALSQRLGAASTQFTGSGLSYFIDQSLGGGLDTNAVIDRITFNGAGGGAINAAQSNLTISNCTFVGFSGHPAVNAVGSTSQIQNCIFQSDAGGAIAGTSSSLQITGCTIAACGGSPAALAVDGSNAGAPSTVTATQFIGDAGAADVRAGAQVTFEGCTWKTCTSGNDDAVLDALAGTTVIISDSLIAANHDTAESGAIQSGGTLTLIGDTIADNTNSAASSAPSIVQGGGTLTVENTILWNNRTAGSTDTIEHNQLPAGGAVTVSNSIVEGLNAYAGAGNEAYDPLFDATSASGYALLSSSPAIDAGNSSVVTSSTDAAGGTRIAGAAVDIGAFESAAFPSTPVALAVNPGSGSSSPVIRVWSTLPGSATVVGSPATIAALQWQTLVNGAWVPVAGGGLAVTSTSTRSTLTVTLTGSEAIPDQQARFVVVGTAYVSPTYRITTASNVIYVNAGNPGSAAGDGLSWATAFRSLADAINAATPHSEVWVAAGTYSQAFTIPSGVRLYGGFTGVETILGARSSDSSKVKIQATVAIASGDSSPVLDTLTLSAFNPVAFTNSGASVNDVAFVGTTVGAASVLIRNSGQTVDFEQCSFNSFYDFSIDAAGAPLIVNQGAFTGARGITTTGALTLTASTFTSLSFNVDGVHGALNVTGTAPASLSGCTFSGNSSYSSPCYLGTTGAVTISRCAFNGNQTRDFGAGALEVNAPASLAIDHSSFANNATIVANTVVAGALAVTGTTVSIRDSYFAGTTTTMPLVTANYGGAIRFTDCAATLVGDTIVNNANTGQGTGGIYSTVATGTSSLALTNCLVWGNTAARGPGASATEAAQVLLGAGATVTADRSLVAGLDTLAGPGMLGVDPQLTTQGGYLAPGAASPALNAGDGTAVQAGEVDLLGNPRLFGSAPDLGAVEFQAAAGTPVESIAQSATAAGGYLTVSGNTGGRTDLVWQIKLGGTWQTIPAGDVVSDVTNGSIRSLEVAWLPASLSGASVRLADGSWTSGAVTLNFTTSAGANGHVLSVTPGPGTPATSTRPVIALALDEAFQPGSIVDSTLVVNGSQRGRLLAASGSWGTLTTNAIAPTLTPGISFAPGEIVEVSASRTIATTFGGTFAPYVSRFRIPWTTRAGALRQGAAFAGNATFTGAAVGDLDGDGHSDVLLAGPAGAAFYLGDGFGAYRLLNVTSPGAWDAVAAADFTGAGRSEFVGSIGGASLVVQALAADQSSVVSLLASPLAFAGTRLLPGDFTGDGRQDILVLGPSTTDGEALLVNQGNGTFAATSQRFATTDRTQDAAVADLDRNGALDFVQLCASGNLNIWLNDGAGNFTNPTSIQVVGAVAFALADVDGDGYPDLVIAGGATGGDTLHYWRNDHTGHFVHMKSWPAGPVQQIAAADFNGDGTVDLLAVTSVAPDVLWTNDGTGTFTAVNLAWTSAGAGANSHALVADINNDGAADVLLPQGGGQPLLWTPGILFSGAAKSVNENASVTFAATDFTATTQSYAAVTLTGYQVTLLPANGTLALNGTAVTLGQTVPLASLSGLTYAPSSNFYGTDSFRLAPLDGSNVSPAGWTTLTVNRVYGPPVAQNLTVNSVWAGTTVSIQVTGTDAESQPLTYALASPAAHGTVSYVGGQTFSYTANAGYLGADTFTYSVNDGQGNVVTGTVTINVLNTVATVTSTAASGAGTLDAALAQAASHGGSWIVTLDPSLAGKTISVAAQNDSADGPTAYLIQSGDSVTIDGTAAPGASIQPLSPGGNLRLFRVADGGALTLTKLTISGWSAQSSASAAPARGGAIYDQGQLTLNAVNFVGNSAAGTGGANAEGGAIYFDTLSGGTQTGTVHCNGGMFLLNAATAAGGSATGKGGAIFDRNGVGAFDDLTFGTAANANTATTAGGDVALRGEGGVAASSWDQGTVVRTVSATVAGAQDAVLINVYDASLPSALAPYVAPIATQLVTVNSALPVAYNDLNAAVTLQQIDYAMTSGQFPPPRTVSTSQGMATITWSPAAGSSGVAHEALSAAENGVTYSQYFTLNFNVSASAPTVSGLNIAVVDGQPVTFSLASAATSADGGPLTYAFLNSASTPFTTQHGTISGTVPNSLTYTPGPSSVVGAFGAATDSAPFQVTGDNGLTATGNVYVYVLNSSVLIDPSSATGQLADLLVTAAYAPAATFHFTYSATAAVRPISPVKPALSTPAGSASYVITGHVVIDGSAVSGMSLVGSGSSRLFYIAPGGRLELKNLALNGGTATGAGGAVYNDGGELDATNVQFNNNSATTSGGAVYSRNGTVKLTGCSFSGSSAAQGADVSLCGSNADQQLTAVQSSITGLVTELDGTGTLEVYADAASAIAAVNAPVIAVSPAATVQGGLLLPLTVGGGGSFNNFAAVSDAPATVLNSWLSLTGTPTAPVLRIWPGASSTAVSGTVAVTGVRGAYTFERDVAITTVAYAAPTLNDQTVSTTPGAPVGFTLTGTYSSSLPLTYAVVTSPTGGTISGTGPNLTYTPANNLVGSDSAVFEITDGLGNSATATVTFQMTSQGAVPMIFTTSQFVPENTTAGCQIFSQESNQAVALSGWAVVTPPAHGHFVVTKTFQAIGGGVFEYDINYTPDANFLGTDSMTFTVSDPYGQSDTETQVFNIVDESTDLPPIITGAPSSLQVAPGATINPLAGVTVAAGSPSLNLNLLPFVTNPDPSLGTIQTTDFFYSLDATHSGIAGSDTPDNITAQLGDFTFTVNPSYAPQGSVPDVYNLQFSVQDDYGKTTTVTIPITIVPAGPAPTASPVAAATLAQTAVPVTLSGTQANGYAVGYQVATAPAHGTLSGTGANLTYTPAAGFFGTDTFTYVAKSATGSSTPATVTITVSVLTPALAVSPRAGGGATVQLTGSPFAPYPLYVSTDLSHWTLLSSVTPQAGGAGTYADATAPADGTARYYRTVANTVPSDPVGVLMLRLRGSSDSVVSLPQLRPSLGKGSVGAVAGPVLTLGFTTPALPAEGAYALVMTGSLEGAVLPITAVNSGKLTVAAGGYDLTQLKTVSLNGSALADLVEIVPYWTLDTAFPQGMGLTASTSTTSPASQVLVYDDSSPGTNFAPSAQYYYFAGNASQTAGWYKTGGGTVAQGATRLAPLTFFTVRNNGAADTHFEQCGNVQMAGYRVPVAVLQAGVVQDNLLAIPAVGPMTLDGIGLRQSGVITTSTSLTSPSDEVIFYDNTSTILPKAPSATYFYFVGNAARPAGWYQVGNLAAPVTGLGVNPGEGMILRKRADSAAVIQTWSAVPSYLQ